MKNDTNVILCHLEAGLQADTSRLRSLENDLTATLHRARRLSEEPENTSPLWQGNWDDQWERIERVMNHINQLVDLMEGQIISASENRLGDASQTLSEIQSEDHVLIEALGTMRGLADHLPAAAHRDWDLLTGTYESYLEVIHACAQAQHIKLELLQKATAETSGSTRVTTDAPTSGPLETYAQQLAKAAITLHNEQHEARSLGDVLRALMMWVEAPAERVRRERSLP